MKIKKLQVFSNKLTPVETVMTLLVGGALIAVIVLLISKFILPLVGRTGDNQRKNDLRKIEKAFAAYHQKKGCYPRADEVCYDPPVNFCGIPKIATSKLCHICGVKQNSIKGSALGQFIEKLPCNGYFGGGDYLYQVTTEACSKEDACQGSICPSDYCPQMYRVYTKLLNPADEDSKRLGCRDGACGIHPNDGELKNFSAYGYDFGVSSPQIGLEKRK